jgi:glutamate synthase domain-containing protein 1
MMFHDLKAKEETDAFFDRMFLVDLVEPMPTRAVKGIGESPHLWRYFLQPEPHKLEESEMSAEDYVVHAVMTVNATIDGAYVASSGKNMGAFKGVGYPEEIGHFYRLEEYEGHTWTGHNRFPTNTPGWWGGAHPFTLLDWSIVHNGEISSYGINSRYLEQFGYKCTLGTDTEVAAYLFDLLLRRHKLPLALACKALSAPLWDEIDRMSEQERDVMRSLRAVYGPALLNGPFAIVLGFNGGMVALNDRIKLRPLVAARKGSRLMVASEESAIRTVMPEPDKVWAPKAGEPVVARVEGMEWPIHGDLHASPSEVSCAVTGTDASCEPAEVI